MSGAEKTNEKLTTKEETVRDSIANITDAVCTVVTHSTNDQFRQKCFSLLQVANSSGLASSLSSQLQSIAHHHLGITWPHDINQTGSKSCQTSEVAIVTQSQEPPACSSQLKDQAVSQRLSTQTDGVECDELAEFLQVDFSEDEPCMTSTEASCTTPSVEAGAAVEQPLEPEQSLEVLQSTLGKDWFDQVLDEDLLFNES